MKMSLFVRSSVHSCKTQPLHIDICVPFFKKERFIPPKTAQRLVLCLSSEEISPATHTGCHFSKWLPIKQNDFFCASPLKSRLECHKSLQILKTKSLFSLRQWQTARPLVGNDVWLSAQNYIWERENGPYSASVGPGALRSPPRRSTPLRHSEKSRTTVTNACCLHPVLSRGCASAADPSDPSPLGARQSV